jgi:hypothetical protein
MSDEAIEDTGTEESPDLVEGADEEVVEEPEVDTTQYEGAKFTLVVNGKEVEVTGKELKAAYQRGQSGAERLREAAELRKQVDAEKQYLREVAGALRTPEGFLEYLMSSKGDPMNFLREVAKLAKEEASLSDEARELREHKKQLAKYQAAEKQKQEQEKLTTEQAETEAWEDAYADAFDDGLDELGIPDDDDLRDELLPIMSRLATRAMNEGDDPFIEDLAKEAWEIYQKKYGKIAKVGTQKGKGGVPGVRPAQSAVRKAAEAAAPPNNPRLKTIKNASGRQVKIMPSGANFRDLFSDEG